MSTFVRFCKHGNRCKSSVVVNGFVLFGLFKTLFTEQFKKSLYLEYSISHQSHYPAYKYERLSVRLLLLPTKTAEQNWIKFGKKIA